MCGIVGAASARNVVPILIEGIRRLGVSRLRLHRPRRGRTATDGAAPRSTQLVSTGAWPTSAQAQDRKLTGMTGIAHAVGDARRRRR